MKVRIEIDTDKETVDVQKQTKESKDGQDGRLMNLNEVKPERKGNGKPLTD